jgi:hypothetical protein
MRMKRRPCDGACGPAPTKDPERAVAPLGDRELVGQLYLDGELRRLPRLHLHVMKSDCSRWCCPDAGSRRTLSSKSGLGKTLLTSAAVDARRTSNASSLSSRVSDNGQPTLCNFALSGKKNPRCVETRASCCFLASSGMDDVTMVDGAASRVNGSGLTAHTENSAATRPPAAAGASRRTLRSVPQRPRSRWWSLHACWAIGARAPSAAAAAPAETPINSRRRIPVGQISGGCTRVQPKSFF